MGLHEIAVIPFTSTCLNGFFFMRRSILAVALAAMVAIGVTSVSAYIEGGWPETCLEMNDMVEASPLGSGAVGIYQRAFGADAEQACQNDHLRDVQRSFAWAIGSSPAGEQSAIERIQARLITPPSAVAYDVSFESDGDHSISARFSGDSVGCWVGTRGLNLRVPGNFSATEQNVTTEFARVGLDAGPFLDSCRDLLQVR